MGGHITNERSYFNKRNIAIGIVSILIVAGLAYMLFRGGTEDLVTGKATIDDLIHSTSERTGLRPEIVVASDADRTYPLMAVPVSAYYEDKDLVRVPLLVAGMNDATADETVSTSVTRFMEAYGGGSGIVIGPLDPRAKDRLKLAGLSADSELTGSPKSVSVTLARAFWSRSDGAVLVSQTDEGYEAGLPATTLAAYLDIPVIVCDGIDGTVRDVLNGLGVSYTIACGPVSGYGRTMRMRSSDDVISALALGMESRDGTMKSVMRDRLGITPNYVTLANPMDTVEPSVLDSFTERFSGRIRSTESGSTSDPSLSDDAAVHHITVPEDYQYARIKVRAALDFADSPIPMRTPEDDGQRGYLYVGYDADQDGALIGDGDSEEDHLEFMVPTLSYAYLREGGVAVSGIAYTEEPLYNAQGIHAVEMLATLAYDPLGREMETDYRIEVTVEKLDSANHPLMPMASVCAPYLTVIRGGLLLSDPSFSIYESENLTSMRFFGDPSQDHTANDEAGIMGGLAGSSNDVALGVKERLNGLLSELLGVPADGLAQRAGGRLASDPLYVGIVADTNMVPMYYYPTSGQGELPQEGYGIAGDLFYASVDADPDDPPNDLGGARATADLAVGRIDGWDAQDISALICRTIFYEEIIDSFDGIRGAQWKDSAINNFGSQVPVGASVTVSEKITEAEQRSGFSVDHFHYSPLSDSRLTRDLYQRSNFIYFCAHGFYYWFVPPGYKDTSVGGSYNVANVIEMNFGPSVLFGSSCVTGKIDGIMAYNALSQAFLHSGMNTYIGASRLSWGAAAIIPDMQSGEAFGNYLCLIFYGHLTGYMYDKQGSLVVEGQGDMTVGQSLALAKNLYAANEGYTPGDANSDTLCEFNVHGDPAFDPYEPNHSG